MHDLTVYAHILGDEHAETIVFLPGFTGSHAVWDAHFQGLSTRYRLVLLDTLGFGRSPKPDIDYMIDDHLAAIHATVQALQIDTLHLVGHSMGCLLALAYAERFPTQVDRLLLALPWYRNESEARATVQHSSLFNRWLALDTPFAHIACDIMCRFRPLFLLIAPMLARQVPAVVARDALQHTWTSYSRTLQHVIFESHTQTWSQGLKHSLLIMQGIYDTIAPIDHVRPLSDQLPHARLIALAAEHNLIFTHSAIIAAELAAFLQTA